MFFKKKAFTITIGNKGAILALHNNKKIENKFFIESLSRNYRDKILDILQKNKKCPIYILLDNSEQIYTNKTYPATNIIDLYKIIKRYEIKEFKKPTKEDEKQIAHNHIVKKNKTNKNWECMYISSIYFEAMDDWIKFLLRRAPNYIKGIYMLPIEIANIVKNINSLAKNNKKKNVNLIITQNKVSGIRQTILMNNKIIFTRIAHYDFGSKNFITEFEQDIFRTTEYLKRILPNLGIKDINIINILPSSILEKIRNIKNSEISFNHYTPREFANLNKRSNLLPKNSQYSDILIANIFVNSRKILRFNNKKIQKLFYFDISAKIINIMSVFLIMTSLIYLLYIQIEQIKNNTEFNKLSEHQSEKQSELSRIKKSALEDASKHKNPSKKHLEMDEIIEFGKFDEILSENKSEPIKLTNQLEFINKEELTIKNLDFKNSFSFEENRDNIQFKINANINNKNGEVEDLFKIYDQMILNFKNNFKNKKIIDSGLPKNIDYSKKYYEIPITITIKNK